MTKRYDPEQVTHPLDVAQSAASVGVATAVPGLAIGSFYGTLKTTTPVLFSIASGAQCFAIGTTFWTARTAILNQDGLQNWWNFTRGVPLIPRNDQSPSLSDKVRASTIAGAFTGISLGLLLRGPRNVVPGTIMFTLFGWGGQKGYNFLDKRNSQELREQAQLKALGEDRPKETLVQKFAKSKWSPMSILTDEQYEEMLQEKLLKVEADIAIIDERIEAVKKMAIEEEGQRALREQEDGSQEKR
ncbi:hypothetical protein HBI56_090790 [Parastagonospora nodorum]|nr:hypothetical protein HBH53_064420 [Parastagonospora nodorum]KAH3974355.1 hypothetical protein HBH51_093850 [Parastagonospora nodorum]KAH3979025.1 hypothetical protein HBH52_101820 [Parastagonospora nodorum]KAH4048982.1 hypothetical protein HBH49_153860 [Parastagonospora nodorum]KAH4065932.1 hypothetical protein HBH50_152490 [Parastagonospora nodorum]